MPCKEPVRTVENGLWLNRPCTASFGMANSHETPVLPNRRTLPREWTSLVSRPRSWRRVCFCRSSPNRCISWFVSSWWKCAAELLEILLSKLVQLQAVTCSENQVIKAAKVREKAFRSLFVGDVNRLSPCFSSDRLNRFLNSFGFAGDDHDLGSPRRRRFGHCQTDPRRSTYDDPPFFQE